MAGPKPTADVSDATPIPGTLRAAVDLDAVLVSAMRSGAHCFGQPVEEVKVLTDDGEWRTFGLPAPVEEKGLTPTRRKVVATLAESPVPMTRKQLGGAVGRQPWGGKFGADVAALVESGAIFERDGLLTNDVRKFPQLS